MPDILSAVRAKVAIEETGEADFPCIRFYDSERSAYLYGELYGRQDWETWEVGDVQQGRRS